MEPAEAEPEPVSSDDAEILRQVLYRLDALLARAVIAAQAIYGPQAVDDLYRGLYISQDEAVRLLAREPGKPFLSRPPPAAPSEAKPHLPRRFSWLGKLFGRPEQAEATAEPQQEGAQDAGIAWWTQGADLLPLTAPAVEGSRFAALREAYNLSDFELDLVLLALAPELDLRYERLYAFLQDDVTRRRPSVDLALNLLCLSAEDKQARRACFAPAEPLVRDRLIHLFPSGDDVGPPLLAVFYQLDPQIVAFLLDLVVFDPRLAPLGELIAPGDGRQESLADADAHQALVAVAGDRLNSGQPLRLYFHGAHGAGKRAAAEALALGLVRPLVVVNLPLALAADRNFSWLPQVALREAWLHDAVLYLSGFDALRDDEARLALQRLWSGLLIDGGVTILGGTLPWSPVGDEPAGVISIEFPLPSYDQRLELWRSVLDAVGAVLDEAQLARLAGRFRLTPAQIAEATAVARGTALLSHPGGLAEGDGRPNIDDLFAAARSQTGHQLANLARRIEPRYRWPDLILPQDSLDQLEEICQRVEQREQVLDRWGFAEKHARSRGITTLFAGASGTGKTMAAEVIAARLGLDLYRIDLSSVVSKYIGETEKNLERIFQAAENANAILFFDEADALFGKRSEVRDSHDRYANIEISYLLQKMEEYDGIAILATNLRQNLDDSFTRRMAFTVNFPFPDEPYRRQIWEGIWPGDTPRAFEPSELSYLSAQFRLAGGNIKNIAVGAAYLAAAEGESVSMDHLLRATRREYQKMGKTLTEAELSGRLKRETP
jgi:hypothetical protein